MKVEVDRDTCVGCGFCVGVCPAVFSMGEDGTSYVVEQPADGQAEVACREAAAGCPVSAITLTEDE